MDCQKKEGCIHIHWIMIRHDMPEILRIENKSFEFPWKEEDFIRCLRKRDDCSGIVVRYKNKIIGFAVYMFLNTKIRILTFAVDRDYRNQGIGSKIIAYLIEKLSYQHFDCITLEIRETNLPAQLLFRKNGFRAILVLRNFYENTTEDAYLMEYEYKPEKVLYTPANRISKFVW